MRCFQDADLGVLPKGSRCIEPKEVPARSGYWRDETDSVERCAKYSTGGDRDSDRAAPDREPAPDRDRDDNGGGGEFDCGPESVGPWERVECNEGRVVWETENGSEARGGLPTHADISLWVVKASNGWRLTFKWEGSTGIKTKRAGTEDTRKEGIERAVSLMERDADDAPEPPEPRDDPLGDEPVRLQTHLWDLTVDALRQAAAWYSELDMATSAIKAKEAADTIDDQRGKTRSLEDQVEGDWKHVVNALRFVAEQAEADGDPSDSAGTLREIADVIIQQTEDDDGEDDEEESADIPGDVNGWEAVDFDSLPIADHRDHGYAWERWVPPTPNKPDQRKERLLIYSDDDESRWHVRQAYLDGDREQIDTGGTTRFPELPDKRSMTRGTQGKVTSFSDLDRAVDPVRERMENRPSEQTDWPEIPRFNIQTEIGDLKNVAQLIKRTAPRDPSTYSHGVIEVDAVDLTLRGTDDDNVAMYDIDLLKDGFETTKHNRDAGWDDSREQEGTAAVDAYALADAIADHNKGDSAMIETGQPGHEPNAPVEVRVDQESVATLWPEEYARDPDLPDLEWDTSMQILEAGELDAALQEHTPTARFEVTSGRRFYVSDDEGTGKDEIQASIDYADDEPVTSKYSSDFLRNLTMSVPRPSSTGLKLRYADDFPCKFELRTGPHEIDYLTAPRITTEQPDDVGQSEASVSPSDGPLASARDIPGTAYSTLREAWQGLKIALSNGDREDAKQFACVINGVRAGHEMAPLEFDSLNGFKCEPSGMSQPDTSCPFDGIDLREPLQSGEPVPDSVAEAFDLEGDAVIWTFPKADGCRCGSQALQLDQLAREQGVTVYGIAAAPPEELQEMANRLDLSFTLVSDPEGELASEFGVEMDDGKLDRHLFYVRDGRITDVQNGMMQMSQPDECPLSDHSILGQSDEPKLFDSLEHPGVYLVTGQRGSGKSSLAHRIAEGYADRHNVKPVTVGMPHGAREHYPDNWLHVEGLDDAPPDSVIVVDEAYAKFNARDAMSDENKSVSQMVNTSRHCAQTYLFVAQNAAHVDVNAASEADGLLMKEPGTFHMEFERRQFRDLSEQAKAAFDQLPNDLDNREYVYVYTDDHQGLVRNSEADFYDDSISRSFSASCEL